MSEILVELSENIKRKSIPLEIGVLIFTGVSIYDTSQQIDEEYTTAIQEILETVSIKSLSSDIVIREIRNVFKAFGIDPTRWRPSSEAMIRRILKAKGLYRINSLVDINNIVSIKCRLPIGLYDLNKTNGQLTIDIGNEDEAFIGLTGRKYNAAKKPVVRDQTGIIGSPIVDSERTKITGKTTEAAAVIFATTDGKQGILENAMCLFQDLMKKHHPESVLRTATTK